MRTIKRYENRKLYDTEAKAYVSLADLAELVRSGKTIRVVDNVTDEDITAQALTQVILEEGRQGESLLPTDLLHDLVRRGSKAVDSGIEQLRYGVDDLIHTSMDRIGKVLKRPKQDELEQLHRKVVDLERVLADLMAQQVTEETNPESTPTDD